MNIPAKFFPKDVMSEEIPTKAGDLFDAMWFGSVITFRVVIMGEGCWLAEVA